ncbi:MAG: ShlB/FhaC/HecB family hemolysin secretion/activation protein [Betaproteobacteria bacterium]|nr:ShlB/FhaC/HecB family hemolysin secretion/activation protein [Betaproteobacteria bacterium]
MNPIAAKPLPIRRLLVLLLALAAPALADEPPQPAAAPAAANAVEQAEGRFDVMEFQVEGNTVLPAVEIENAVYPFLGKDKTIQDVEKARTALEKTYHEAGYLTVLVDIPEQDVANGTVRLKTTEATVSRLRVSGSRYYSLGKIRAAAPSLAEGSVPYFPDVQKEIAALNTAPDRRVTPVLRAGKSPGTVEVDLKVDDKPPLHGSIEANNRYSPNTTHSRLAAMLRYDNLWQRQHSLTLNVQAAPENIKDSKVLSASYLMPLAPETLLAAYAVRSRSDVATAGSMNVVGNGNIYGLRAIFSLPSRQDLFHSLTLGVDYKAFGETLVLQGADNVNTPITYVPMMAQYSATLPGKEGMTQFNLGVNFGLRGVLGNNDADFENKRYKAHANYFVLKGDVLRTQNLPRGWSLSGKVETQIASQALISNEQFGAGGAESVRGYLESERMGDNAVRGSLELRAANLLGGGEGPANQFYPLAFLEGASLSLRDPLAGQTRRYTLSSTGLGLRLKLLNGLMFDIDVARPFKDGASTLAGDNHVHARLAYGF